MWRLSDAGLIERLVVFKHFGGTWVPAGEIVVDGAGLGRFGRFAYARSYLARADRRPIDPVGPPFGPRFRSPMPERIHLAFHDAGPDGWGKGVLDRAFPSLRLRMPEDLALGGLRRTGDLAFGPTPPSAALCGLHLSRLHQRAISQPGPMVRRSAALTSAAVGSGEAASVLASPRPLRSTYQCSVRLGVTGIIVPAM